MCKCGTIVVLATSLMISLKGDYINMQYGVTTNIYS